MSANVGARMSEPHDPKRCTACRGTGRVTSTLGGSPASVTCPWCEGSGEFIPGHDAQAAQTASR